MYLIKRAGSGFVLGQGAGGSYLPLSGGTLSGDFYGQAGGIIGWDGLTKLSSAVDGKVLATNAAVTAGVLLDLTTDAQLTLRNRANSAAGNLSCGIGFFGNGSTSAPSMSFASEPTLGFYRPSAGIIRTDNVFYTSSAFYCSSIAAGSGNVALSAAVTGKLLLVTGGTSGISLDLTTDGTLFVKTRGDSNSATILANSFGLGASGSMYWTGHGILSSPADGQFLLTDAANANGGILKMTTDGYFQLRNRTDTGYGQLICGGIYTVSAFHLGAGGDTYLSSIANGNLRISDSAGTTGARLDCSVADKVSVKSCDGTAPGALDAAGGSLVEVRLATIAINLRIATKQALYTVPTGKTAIIDKVVVRSASRVPAALTAGGFGGDSGCTDWMANDQIGQLLTDITKPIIYSVYSTAAAVTQSYAAGTVFGWLALTPETQSTSVTVDVFGYLF